MRRQSFVLVISGPSGAGKSTFVRRLLDTFDDLTFSVSATTRQRRRDEVDGREYRFLRREEFESRVAHDDFLEHAEVHGELYGTLVSEVRASMQAGKSVLLDVDIQGGVRIKRHSPEVVLVFLLPPDLRTLQERLCSRGTDDQEVIARRLANAPREIQMLVEYDYVVINETVEATQRNLEAIFRAEKLKRQRLPGGADAFVEEYLNQDKTNGG